MSSSNDEIELRRAVLLAFQAALIAEVTPNLRAVTVAWDEREIRALFIYDGEVGDEDRERAAVVGTEAIAHFPAHMISEEVIRLDAPQRLDPLYLMAWVYMRCEMENWSFPVTYHVERRRCD